MVILRPIKKIDFNGLWNLAKQTNVGFTSLQPNHELVQSKLDWAVNSFQKKEALEESYYLFVLEDTDKNEIMGVSAIKSAVGIKEPWYEFKVTEHMHQSIELGISKKIKSLNLCSDHSGSSELCTLFLSSDFRGSNYGAFLSKSRFMFMGIHLDCFNEITVAELRGYFDANNCSPFWDDVMRHFFDVEFVVADQASVKNKEFIAQLMPRQPILTCLMHKKAQEVIGKTHKSTKPAMMLLKQEGFEYKNYIDIFDAGPLLEVQTRNIKTIRELKKLPVSIVNKEHRFDKSHSLMVSNHKFEDFCCLLIKTDLKNKESIFLTSEQSEILSVKEGDIVSVTKIK